MDDSRWETDEQVSQSVFGIAGMGALRFALLFGSAAVALTLILAPIAENQTRKLAISGGGVDRMSTGSVPTGSSYTLRRSVLQETPSAICIIHDDGRRTGNCR
ncbi:MAG: hypothetical protein WBF87_01735 [Mesorhizobium sp.]